MDTIDIIDTIHIIDTLCVLNVHVNFVLLNITS